MHPLFTDEAEWETFLSEHRPFREAFPDFHTELDGAVGEGDYLVWWTTVSGTFTRPFDGGGLAGIEPKGQKLKWREVNGGDFSGPGGEPVDGWHIIDEQDRLRQLGEIQ